MKVFLTFKLYTYAKGNSLKENMDKINLALNNLQ